ncbi:MAG: type II toxin-antitoxin system ParD family antitoxin [Gammaproteobacteria bacterium]
MPTRSVILTERRTQILENPVQSGQYKDTSEVIRDTLCLR